MYVQIQEVTSGFVVIVNPARDLESRGGYDDWVEALDGLSECFVEAGWTIHWDEEEARESPRS